MPAEERREFQRLLLSPTVPGTLSATPVSILEIGVLGARVQHAAPLEGRYPELRFSWKDQEVALKCEIVRIFNDGTQSAMRFLSAIGDSGDHLRDMLAELVLEALEKRRGDHFEAKDFADGKQLDGDKTVRGRDAAFITYRFEKGTWQRRAVFLPEQPTSGFTVARTEDTEEMQRLCRVYAASDDEGRRLIRLFAELSVSETMQIPPQSPWRSAE